MAVTYRDLRHNPSQRLTGQHRVITGQFRVVGPHTRDTSPLSSAYVIPAAQPRTSRTPHVITAVMALIALALMVHTLVGWVQTTIDDLRYGRPRTTTLSGFVGHNETGGVPTQFVAMNLNRRVVVLEIPGGDPAKIRTLTGPYLFGIDEDMTPIHLRLARVNDDNLSDLVVSVKNEEIVYINENENFRLISPEERAALQQRSEQDTSAVSSIR